MILSGETFVGQKSVDESNTMPHCKSSSTVGRAGAMWEISLWSSSVTAASEFCKPGLAFRQLLCHIVEYQTRQKRESKQSGSSGWHLNRYCVNWLIRTFLGKGHYKTNRTEHHPALSSRHSVYPGWYYHEYSQITPSLIVGQNHKYVWLGHLVFYQKLSNRIKSQLLFASQLYLSRRKVECN